MKEGGINASEGANALKSGLASLINPSKSAANMLNGLGINIKGIVEANKGDLKATVVGFAQALDTLDPLNRSRAIEQLFGKFQFARLSTLFQNITKDGTQANRVLGLTQSSVEELAILAEREMKTVEDAVGTNFKASMEQLKLAIAPVGKAFLQAVTPIIKVIGNLLDKFNNLSDGSKKFIVVASSIVGIIGPVLLMTFGLLANGLANIVKLFMSLRNGFLRLGGQSKVLGEQTNYLTAEQLEAATVAASLNQAHTNLTQQFALEAETLQMLRKAYVDATTAGANFAKANPGMMMPGRTRMPKKFATGTTGLPGPAGAGDIIPIMAAPGEAIIPAKAAQNPANKPLISALVNQGTLPGFESGTVSVGGKSYPVKSQTTGVRLTEYIESLKQQGYSEERIVAALDKNIERGRPISSSGLKRRLSIGRGSHTGTSQSNTSKAMKEAINASKAGFEQEIAAIEAQMSRRGITMTDTQKRNLFEVQKSHIAKDFADGKKIWSASNLVTDLGYVNNYLNTIERGTLGAELLKKSDLELAQLGIDRAELEALKSGRHPVTAKSAQTLEAIARYDALKRPGSYQAEAVIAGLSHRSKAGFYGQPIETLDKVMTRLKQQAVAEIEQKTGVDIKNAKRDGKTTTRLVAVSPDEYRQNASGRLEKITNENSVPKPPGVEVVPKNAKDTRLTTLNRN